MRRRVSAVETLEATDARKRRNRRKACVRRAGRQRKLHPHATPAARRRQTIESVIAEAGAAPGTLQAFELLQGARDETNRRLMHFAATPLLRSYFADAEAPTAGGWRRIPTLRTQRERADALDISDKYLRNLNRDLVAAGLLRDGGLHYAGDGVRACVCRDGRRYLLPLKRRVWWLAPAVAEIVAGAEAAHSECKARNPFPADLISDQRSVLDPSPSAVGASSESLSSPPSTPAIDRDVSTPPDLSLSFASGSVLDPSGESTDSSEGAAVAAPVDQLQPPNDPPLELVTTDRVTERPTAAQRRELASLDPPTEPTSPASKPSAEVDSSADESPASEDRRVRIEHPPSKVPAASRPRLGYSSRPIGRCPRLAEPADRNCACPEPAAGHPASCDCMPCWIARSVRDGTIAHPPHGTACRCPLGDAWRFQSKAQWQRFRDPVAARAADQRQAETEARANADPTLQLLQTVASAVGSGSLLPADRDRLVALILDGRADEAAVEFGLTQRAEE
jgi:hypothetical protein